jgi:hypothetical protein
VSPSAPVATANQLPLDCGNGIAGDQPAFSIVAQAAPRTGDRHARQADQGHRTGARLALPTVFRLRRRPRQGGGAESEKAAHGARGAQAPVRHLVRLCGLPRRDADPVPVAELHPGRHHSVQSVRAAALREQNLRSPGRHPDHPGHAEGAVSRRAEAVPHGPRRS